LLTVKQEKEIQEKIKLVLENEKDFNQQELLRSLFSYTYHEMTPHLKEQYEEAKTFFSQKGKK
jgi:hypothetical protein